MIPVDPRSVNAPSRRRLRRTAWALGVALGLLVVLAAAVSWLAPLSRFIPVIEARAAAALGQPVRVGAARFHLLPWPSFSVSDVSAGPSLRVERILIRPSLLDLLMNRPVLSEVRVRGIVVSDQLLRAVVAKARSADASAGGVRVQRITFDDAAIELPRARLTDLSGSIRFDPNGHPSHIRVSQHNQRLEVLATPTSAGFALAIHAKDWTSPVGPPVRFERVMATAVLTGRSITAQGSAQLYNGRVSGPFRLSWDKAWSLTGRFDVDGVELEALARLISQDGVSGRLRAGPRFSARAASVDGLLRNLQVDSEFSVSEGVLSRIDLEAAAKNPLQPAARSDRDTRFRELNGRLRLDPSGYHFSRLRVESGLLNASGELSVSPTRQLDGRIDVALKGTGSLIGIPLQISGTTQEPIVRPTKGAVAGVVAGSMLLPGIGTAIGLKAGQLTEKLFHSPRPPAPNTAARR